MGLAKAHEPMLLQEGMTWTSTSMTPDDAQFLLTRGFQVEEICSWFGVPLSLVQHTEKVTSWGTGLSQLMLGFLVFTMEPWLTLWEMCLTQQLIIRRDRFFAEFERKGLLQGDHAARSAFYRTMVQIMAMTPNEVRERENMNPIEGLDEPIVPLNIKQGQEEREREADAMARAAVIPDRYFPKALSLAMDAAGKMVETEIKAVRTLSKNMPTTLRLGPRRSRSFMQPTRRTWQRELRISYDLAAVYCEGQIGSLMESGLQAADRWEKERPAQLAAIMLSGGE